MKSIRSICHRNGVGSSGVLLGTYPTDPTSLHFSTWEKQKNMLLQEHTPAFPGRLEYGFFAFFIFQDPTPPGSNSWNGGKMRMIRVVPTEIREFSGIGGKI